MAMIKCRDCGKMISDAARVCPNCGRPVASQGPTQAKVKGTVTIQKTSKKIKGCGCVSVILILVGICVAYACNVQETIAGTGTSTGVTVASIIIGVGVCGLIGSRIAKWWFHD